MEMAPAAGRLCHVILAGDADVCDQWIEAWRRDMRFDSLGFLRVTPGDSWTVPVGEAGIILECQAGAASGCGEAVAGSLEIHTLTGVDPSLAPVLAPWVSSIARLLVERVSLRRLVDRFGERVRREAARLRMADLLEEANQRLQEEFVRDPLTGVPNRRRFEEHFDLCWGRAAGDGTGIGLILVDIDFFKKLNDSLGHQEGDRCLREVAQALASRVVRSNDIIARFGGEEFVAVVDNCTREEVEALSESLCAGVRDLAIRHPEHPMGIVTISAGAAWAIPGLTSSAEDFLHSADEMLYKAKNSGRNCWILSIPSADVADGN